MKKRILSLFLALLLCFSLSLSALSAAPLSSEAAAKTLAKIGFFQGSAQGFRLNDYPTRAEAAAMLVRLCGYEETMRQSLTEGGYFSDVPESAWYAPYINYIASRGLVSGMGNGCFAPERPITAQQYAAMLLAAIGRPAAYAQAISEAKSAGIFDYVAPAASFTRGDLVLMSFGVLHAVTDSGEPLLDRLITEGAVSVNDLTSEDFASVSRLDYQSALPTQTLTLSLGNRSVSTGTDASLLTAALGERNRIDVQNPDLSWQIFTGNYKAFAMVAVSEGKAVGFYSNSFGASLQGIVVGQPAPDPLPAFPDYMNVTVFYDATTGMVDGILALPKKLSLKAGAGANALRLGRELYDLACAARVSRGIQPLIWSEPASDASLSHSRAMSSQRFFGHQAPDGSGVEERLAESELSYSSYGENIAQGFISVFAAHHQWMNSADHRKTLLNPQLTHLGAAATGDLFYTALFFTPLSKVKS